MQPRLCVCSHYSEQTAEELCVDEVWSGMWKLTGLKAAGGPDGVSNMKRNK